jgi:hypothetical protein
MNNIGHRDRFQNKEAFFIYFVTHMQVVLGHVVQRMLALDLLHLLSPNYPYFTNVVVTPF